MVENTMRTGGAVLFWSIGDATNVLDLKQAFNAAGFGQHAPDYRAASTVAGEAVGDIVGGPLTISTPLEGRRGWFVAQLVKGRDRNRFVDWFTLDLGSLHGAEAVDVPAARLAFTFHPGGPGDYLNNAATHGSTSGRVRDRYETLSGIARTGQVTGALVDVVDALGGTRLRPSGGLYWMAQGATLDRFAVLAEAVELAAVLGTKSRVYIIRHALDLDALRAVRDALQAEVEAAAAELQAEVTSGKLGPKACATAEERAGRAGCQGPRVREHLGRAAAGALDPGGQRPDRGRDGEAAGGRRGPAGRGPGRTGGALLMANLATLDAAARDLVDAAAALEKLQAARSELVMGKDPESNPEGAGVYAFFASLALRLVLERKDDVGTMATDGRRILWALDYVRPLTPFQTLSEVLHETGHNWLQHVARMADVLGPFASADAVKRAQIAADCALDPMLRDAGFWNPPNAIFPAAFGLPEGQSFEWYCANLPPDAVDKAGGAGDRGQVLAPADPAEAEAVAADWQVATQQAAKVAKGRGTLPGWLDDACAALVKHRVDWREVLREFFSVVARDDYSWTPPNRRHIAAGLYLPACRSVRLGRLVVLVDTSSSVSAAAVAAALGELAAVLAERPLAVDVLLHTTRLYQVLEVDVERGDSFPDVKPKRGGTSHADSFAWVRDNAPDALACIAFTDCESDLDTIPAPACPVLFCRPEGCDSPPPAWSAGVLELPA